MKRHYQDTKAASKGNAFCWRGQPAQIGWGRREQFVDQQRRKDAREMVRMERATGRAAHAASARVAQIERRRAG